MTFIDFYHVGVVVADLDAAAAEFEHLLGLTWAAPRRERLRLWTPGGEVDCRFRFTYTRGPAEGPAIELIEAPSGSPWWPGDGVVSTIHHLGFWAHPFGEHVAALEAGGAPVEHAVRDGDRPSLFTYHQLAHGPRIELVDAARRDELTWWADR